jgi:hypothetical protein
MAQNSCLQIAKTVEQLSDIRDEWMAMQSNPAADLEFYLTLLKTRTEILRPHVIRLRNCTNTPSILIGRLEWKRLTVGLGYGKLLLPRVRCLTLLGTGLLGDGSDASVSALMRSVEISLRNEEADVAWFHQLEAGSNIYRTVKESGGFLCRDHFPSFSDHWKVQLPGTYEQFLQQRSSKTRNNLKRNTKRLQDLLEPK